MLNGEVYFCSYFKLWSTNDQSCFALCVLISFTKYFDQSEPLFITKNVERSGRRGSIEECICEKRELFSMIDCQFSGKKAEKHFNSIFAFASHSLIQVSTNCHQLTRFRVLSIILNYNLLSTC